MDIKREFSQGLWICLYSALVFPNAALADPLDGRITNSAPSVELKSGKSSYEVDIGKVSSRESHSVAIRLTNGTQRTLKASSLKSSCGCVAAKLTSELIEPSQEISVNLNVVHDTGKFQKSVTLDFGEKDSPVSIQIAGEAVERFRAEPAILYLSAKQSNREVVMFPQFENSLQGASAKGLGDLVQVTDIEASQDKLILKVAIRNTKDLFWRGANSTSELIEISVGGKK